MMDGRQIFWCRWKNLPPVLGTERATNGSPQYPYCGDTKKIVVHPPMSDE